MEYLEGGSLMDTIKRGHSSGSSILTCDCSKIVKEILEAVAYLHSLDTAHRDLKPGMIR